MIAALINSRLNLLVQPPTPFGLGRNGSWPFRGFQLPWALLSNKPFFAVLTPERPQKGLSLARLRLLILLLLLMSGNVHPNPGPILPRSVCAGNVTWRGKSVQCCTSSKLIHLRCSLLSSKFRTLGSSHSWSFPLAASVFSGYNTVISSSDSSSLYTSTVQSGPLS